jgi:iron complex transport system substrate-binding protein
MKLFIGYFFKTHIIRLSASLFLCQCILISSLSAREVTDQTGRTITVPDTPQRVVALAPSITEIVFALGRGNLLIGATQFSDYPPEADKIPKVGSYIHLDLEKIVALGPDLCLAVKDGNPIDVVRRLENLNIPVYAVDPMGLNPVMKSIGEIGTLLHAEDRARSLIQDMNTRIERVKQTASQVSHRPGVFLQIGVSPIVAPGSATFIHELIVTAGGKNLSEGSTPYPRFSQEQVLALAPEIMIITSMTRGEMFQRVKTEWERWPDIPAVKNGRIYIVDSNLFDRPGPRMIDGLEKLFEIIQAGMKNDG